MEREQDKTQQLDFGLWRWPIEHLPVKYKLYGRENIDSVRELIANGMTVTAVIDHRSLADFITGSIVGIKQHFDDLIQSAYIVMKISYVEQFPFLMRYLPNVIPMIPHTMPDYPRKDEINKRAIIEAQNLPSGSIIVIAPEGTCSGQVSMQEARYGAQRFWHGPDDMPDGRYILPIAIERTEKHWSKGKMWRTLPQYPFRSILFRAKFILGEPVAVSEIDRIAYQLSQSPEDYERLKTDVVMGYIALLHMTRGNPRYAGRYRELAEKIQKLKSAA